MACPFAGKMTPTSTRLTRTLLKQHSWMRPWTKIWIRIEIQLIQLGREMATLKTRLVRIDVMHLLGWLWPSSPSPRRHCLVLSWNLHHIPTLLFPVMCYSLLFSIICVCNAKTAAANWSYMHHYDRLWLLLLLLLFFFIFIYCVVHYVPLLQSTDDSVFFKKPSFSVKDHICDR